MNVYRLDGATMEGVNYRNMVVRCRLNMPCMAFLLQIHSYRGMWLALSRSFLRASMSKLLP